MSRLRVWLAAAAVVVLAACAADGGTSPDREQAGLFVSSVDVDTPALRAARKAAGIEACPRPGRGGPSADGLPPVVLRCLGGGPSTNLARLEGPLVVNLWAQWCGPCRDELPHYARLHREAGDQVAVVGIDYKDTQPLAALELLARSGATYPSFADPEGRIDRGLRVRGLPAVLLVDREGTLRHVEFTVIRSYGQLRDLVVRHLDVSP